ncbi:MAG: flagellar biosynthesis repressor FlbT [Thermodesulfovibrionales bacterium]
MALKITLKPGERIIIGGAVIKNSNSRSHLIIENRVPVLREKDIMSEKDANSLCRKIYFIIQLMYIDEENVAEYHSIYWKLVREILGLAPRVLPMIDQISEHILCSRYYQALKTTQKLIRYEQEVLNNVRGTG